MKKFLALALALVLCLSLAACSGKTESSSSAAASGSSAASSSSAPAATGSVYYLNFKPEADEAWQKLAKTYTEKTGVEVKVVTAASGTYGDTLTAEMAKKSMPTLFQISNAQALDTWKDYCLDLSKSDVYSQMSDTSLTLKGTDGGVYGVAYAYESYGIIVNKALLKTAGYELSDIKDFASLKKVAEDITARKATLGFSAFTSAGLESSSSWRFSGHLANLPLFYEFRDDKVESQPATIKGTYLENYKNIWDLYMNNGSCAPTELSAKTGNEAESEFGEGKAVFFQNGSWEYSALTAADKFAMKPEDLAMIPIYCGVAGEDKAGLCSGTESFWAVNSKAPAEDIQATLDFMNWCVTSDEGTAALADDMGFVSPFKTTKAPANVFLAQADEYAKKGCYNVSWAFNYTPNVDTWRAGVVAALTQYAAGGPWDDVVTAFVKGWETQYKAQTTK